MTGTRLAVVATFMALAGTTGCGDHSPSNPTPILTPSITEVQPRVALTEGGSSITLLGSGFVGGATVTLGGSIVTITRLSSNQIEGTIPSHGAGSVDIVVTNPDGRRVTQPHGFTYFATISAPQIERASVNSGSAEGGTPLVVSGHGFFPGVTLTIDGVRTAVNRVGTEIEGWSGSFIEFAAPAHAVGRVDIVVTNPDGQSSRLASGYEYVLPESLDFNGDWVVIGDDFGELDTLHFRIQDNIVVSVACDGKELTYSPQPSVERGAFTVSLSGSGSLTGRIVGPPVAIGTLKVAACSLSGAWTAWKYEGNPTRR